RHLQEGPPPHPNFTMKGRSPTKLLRQIETWHGELGREKDVMFQSWQPCGTRPWEMEDKTESLGKVRWTVQELLSSWELAAHGRAMHHCVVSYSDRCADGNTAIWSINALRDGETEREDILTVAMDIKAQTVTQARGRHNMQANKAPKSAQAKQEAQTGYSELLNRSNTVLNEWMQRERITYDR
ncbi:MAG: PcfJ domain-containing protein, partial [Candidatus Latescibacteria bacterium]|nr:PcfJ domain-containing protein [Candidatus Latescibacterota bacterium]